MELKKLNLIASTSAFLLGSIYLFSDSSSITANVVGSSASITSFASVIGLFMILGSIGLFLVSMNSTDLRSIDLERLVRRTKDNSDLNNEPIPTQKQETYAEIKR
ncbi:MAG: hypothetical protein ACP5OA_06935 [Candidatus Woesearchaeota archaeon]